ncbi:MAG: murein biosynthesis integral membrane protein MurJ [Victivallales bacterium]|nr:murein biosynthesis integral membrane protein MurJ [Victivallales bacterium]
MFSSGAGILLSRITGLLRDVATAAYWGATGTAQAAYNVAFSIPNSLRMLLGEGAFSSVFVPRLSHHITQGDLEKAWKLADRAISLQLLILTVFSILTGVISWLLWRCGAFRDEVASQTAMILPILMPFSILVCVQGAFSGVLNNLKVFFLPTFVQVIFNCVQIASIGIIALFWTNEETPALIAFCAGAIIAGFIQLFVLMFYCRRMGYRYHFDLHVRGDREVGGLCRAIIPGIVGNGLQQVNHLIDKALAVSLGAAAVGAINYGHHLIHLPVGLFGAAMGAAFLPALSRAYAAEDMNGAAEATNYAMRMILFLALPCTALFLACGGDLLTLLFARGNFNAQAVKETTYALLFYSAGIPAFCCVKIAAGSFYARKNTVTPMRVSLCCMVVNLILNLTLMQFLRQGGLALATSICSWLNLVVLLWFNRRHLPQYRIADTLRAAVPILCASVLAGAAAWSIRYLLAHYGWFSAPGANGRNCLIAIAELAACGAAYCLGCLLFRCREMGEILRLFLRRLRRG